MIKCLLGHSFGEWKADGSSWLRACSKCTKVQTRKVGCSARNHIWEPWEQYQLTTQWMEHGTPAGETTELRQRRNCEKCQTQEDIEVRKDKK